MSCLITLRTKTAALSNESLGALVSIPQGTRSSTSGSGYSSVDDFPQNYPVQQDSGATMQTHIHVPRPMPYLVRPAWALSPAETETRSMPSPQPHHSFVYHSLSAAPPQPVFRQTDLPFEHPANPIQASPAIGRPCFRLLIVCVFLALFPYKTGDLQESTASQQPISRYWTDVHLPTPATSRLDTPSLLPPMSFPAPSITTTEGESADVDMDSEFSGHPALFDFTDPVAQSQELSPLSGFGSLKLLSE